MHLASFPSRLHLVLVWFYLLFESRKGIGIQWSAADIFGLMHRFYNYKKLVRQMRPKAVTLAVQGKQLINSLFLSVVYLALYR